MSIFAAAALCLFALVSVAAEERGPRYALVVGNARYQRIAQLNNTEKDARDIAAALKKLDYQVDLRIDLTALEFSAAVDAYTARLASHPGSEGFFWYTGHGAQTQGENYLIATDFTARNRAELAASALSLNGILKACERAANKVNIIVVDACRIDPFPADKAITPARGLQAVRDVPGDLVIMFSTAPNDVASDGVPGGNSPFAEAFLKYIDSPEPVNMMIPDVVRETMTLTNGDQRPFMNGSVVNDKYYSLNPRREIPAPSPAPALPAPADLNREGIGLFARGDFAGAIAAFTRAITLDSAYAEAFYHRGLVYHEQAGLGQATLEQAIADFDAALRVNDKYDAAYFRRGLAYADRGDYDRALVDYTASLRLNPRSAKAYNNRANVYAAQREFSRALDDYNAAIRLNPADAAYYHNRGAVYQASGDTKRADADYAEARRLGWKD